MNRILREIINTLLYILFVLALTFLVITYVGQRTQVDGSSMEPTLSNGDSLIVDKISYRFKDPERFDIIVFPFQYQEDTFYIKRIIGLPGETIRIDTKGVIYLTGEDGVEKVLQEGYGKEVIRPEMVGRAIEPITLAEDEYFVMGDNRNGSTDSRTKQVGNIKRKDIVGRAWVRIWPLDRFGALKKKG